MKNRRYARPLGVALAFAFVLIVSGTATPLAAQEAPPIPPIPLPELPEAFEWTEAEAAAESGSLQIDLNAPGPSFALQAEPGASAATPQIPLQTPYHVGGAAGAGDQRDVDIYPAVAFDSVRRRYLAVWLSARQAESSGDGLDVYGAFLDEAGLPLGAEFRISDSNNAARNSGPTVVALPGEFLVIWTRAGGSCHLMVQSVRSVAEMPDQMLLASPEHLHSPHAYYESRRKRLYVGYVEGDDYLPPTLLGAQASSCGNNASSTSQVRLQYYQVRQVAGNPALLQQVSDIGLSQRRGAFRPQLAYSRAADRLLVIWEDRSSYWPESMGIDVYSALVGPALGIVEEAQAVDSGYSYSNFSTNATWTPRPAVAAGANGFMAAWYRHEVDSGVHTWMVVTRPLSAGGSAGPEVTTHMMVFAQDRSDQAPTGHLRMTYVAAVNEFLIGTTTYLDSLWGYFSVVGVQRLRPNGVMLQLNGALLQNPGVGSSLDYQNSNQVSLALMVRPDIAGLMGDILVLYGKHPMDSTATDYNVWASKLFVRAPTTRVIHLPTVSRR